MCTYSATICIFDISSTVTILGGPRAAASETRSIMSPILQAEAQLAAAGPDCGRGVPGARLPALARPADDPQGHQGRQYPHQWLRHG